jgi:hypothetical protein
VYAPRRNAISRASLRGLIGLDEKEAGDEAL